MKRKNILLAFVMVIATFFVGTYVASAVVNAPSQLVINHYTKKANDNPLNVPKDLHIKHTADGKYVYCIDYMLKRPDGKTYTKVSATADKGIAYIVNMGYNNKTETDYFITQSALWLYLDDTNGMQDYKNGTVDAIRQAVYSASNNNNQVALKIRQLVSDAKAAKTIEKPYINIKNKNISFQLTSDKKGYVSNVIEIDTNLSDYTVRFENAPEGLLYSKNNNKLMVYIPADKYNEVDANFNINVSGVGTEYETYIYKASDSKYQPVAVPYTNNITVEDNVNVRLNVETTIVSISKQDITTKKELPGATLVLKDSKGNVIETWVSTDEPHIIYNLPVGKYTLSETKAPEGYELSTETITFEIIENGVKKSVIMYNRVEETPEVPEIPDEPDEEIEVPVEPTSSFAPMGLSIAGIVIIALGSIFIYKNVKTNEK